MSNPRGIYMKNVLTGQAEPTEAAIKSWDWKQKLLWSTPLSPNYMIKEILNYTL